MIYWFTVDLNIITWHINLLSEHGSIAIDSLAFRFCICKRIQVETKLSTFLALQLRPNAKMQIFNYIFYVAGLLAWYWRRR